MKPLTWSSWSSSHSPHGSLLADIESSSGGQRLHNWPLYFWIAHHSLNTLTCKHVLSSDLLPFTLVVRLNTYLREAFKKSEIWKLKKKKKKKTWKMDQLWPKSVWKIPPFLKFLNPSLTCRQWMPGLCLEDTSRTDSQSSSTHCQDRGGVE